LRRLQRQELGQRIDVRRRQEDWERRFAAAPTSEVRQKLLQERYPETYYKAELEQPKIGFKEFPKVGAGGNSVRDPASGEQIFEMWSIDSKGNRLVHQGDVIGRNAAKTVVQMGENWGRRAQIESDQKRLAEWAQASDNATRAIMPVVSMQQLAQREKTYSGFFAPYQKALANILISVGVPVDKERLASSETYEAQMAQWVRGAIKALGSGTAISNVDLAFTVSSGPALANSLEGKKLMLKAMRSDLEWVQDSGNSAREYYETHDYSLRGWKPPKYARMPELKKYETEAPSIREIMEGKSGELTGSQKGPDMAFNSEGPDYDYKAARRAGLKPDSTGHWPSRDPKSGLLLKGRQHPTFWKTVEEEKVLGNEIYKAQDGRYYSRKVRK